MSLREGQRVACISDTAEGAVLGDEGKVLVADEHCAHVRWLTGSRQGQIDLVDSYDLAPKGYTASATQDDDLADSLEVGGSLMVTGAREVYDEGGAVALINAMSESGGLASFASIAEEVLGQVTARVRSDPALRMVVSQLDDEEAEQVVRLASLVLVRDAFGGGE